ncbi:hypothetical protein IO89_06150 [Epilithonimonas lactis]|uniref:Uncharacterized protein n=1 Tax=Epilithonimonas lactis TaxID=421072 RepID=A0A085BJI9_9FLAO|nr:hypothetical protein IO89_06150 [Epilithonimonas lactis]
MDADVKIQSQNFLFCEARPGLNGALFVSAGKSLGTKKREWKTDKGAQINQKKSHIRDCI